MWGRLLLARVLQNIFGAYVQELLAKVVTLRCIQAEDILPLQLLYEFIDPLQGDLTIINLHNGRLRLYSACAPKVDTKVLSVLRSRRHVGATLDSGHATRMHYFLGSVLSLCRFLLICSAADLVKSTTSNVISATAAIVRDLY